MSMNNITINSKSAVLRGETPFKLANGSLVVHYNKYGNVQSCLIVTSFRDHHNKYSGAQTNPYCSLVDLDTGYLKFEERCSRDTTMVRILSHLNPYDYKGAKAVEEGQFIEVYPVGKYKIDLSFDRKV